MGKATEGGEGRTDVSDVKELGSLFGSDQPMPLYINELRNNGVLLMQNKCMLSPFVERINDPDILSHEFENGTDGPNPNEYPALIPPLGTIN